MKRPRYEHARRQASALLKSAIEKKIYQPDDNVCVPVDEIATELCRIVIRSEDLGDKSGVIHMSPTGDTLLAVNKTHSLHRQRFTKAHELGHFKLHLFNNGTIVDQMKYRDNESSLALDVDEIEANQFAAQLLMPKIYVLQEFDKVTSSTLENTNELDVNELVQCMAKTFEVGFLAMKYRLIALDIIN